MTQTFPRVRRLAAASLLALAFAGAGLFATTAEATTYAVTFDTSSIAGTVGSVDFQWNLGVLDPSLTAIVSDFGGASFTDPATLLFGNVSGSLAPGGRLLFAATDPNNYIYQALTFGTSLSFRVALPDSAPAPTPGAFPSEFAISLFDSLLSAALPSTSPAGAALAFELAPGRGPSPTLFTAASVRVVPEPETIALTLMGLALLRLSSRRATRR